MAQHLDALGKINLACESYVLHGDRILLFKRKDDATRFPGYWIGPGGRIDAEEDAMTAAIREVEEETGIRIQEKDITLKALAFHYHQDLQELWVSHVYLATIPETQHVDERLTKEGRGQWIHIQEALTMEKVFPPAKFYFDHLLSNKPGVMYTNIVWENAQLVKINSQRVDVSVR